MLKKKECTVIQGEEKRNVLLFEEKKYFDSTKVKNAEKIKRQSSN